MQNGEVENSLVQFFVFDLSSDFHVFRKSGHITGERTMKRQKNSVEKVMPLIA